MNKALKKLPSQTKSINNIKIFQKDNKYSPISSLSLSLPHPYLKSNSNLLAPVYSHFIKNIFFKTNNSKSTLAITRESEILGINLSSSLDREFINFTAEFQRDDLFRVLKLFDECVDGLRRRDSEKLGVYEREFVKKSKEWELAKKQIQSSGSLVHFVAYRNGRLGRRLNVSKVGEIDLSLLFKYFENLEIGKIEAKGVDFGDLEVGLKNFNLSNSNPTHESTADKYFGGDLFIYLEDTQYACFWKCDERIGRVLKELSEDYCYTTGLFGFTLTGTVDEINQKTRELSKKLENLSEKEIKIGNEYAKLHYYEEDNFGEWEDVSFDEVKEWVKNKGKKCVVGTSCDHESLGSLLRGDEF